MLRRSLDIVVALFSLCAMFLALSTANGQEYPSRPIRIVTAEPGGGSDFVSRLVAQGLTANLNQQVIVENRGGDASIPGTILFKAQPDGYTLLIGAGTLWIGPLMQKTPYDPIKDFIPITWVMRSMNILVVHPSVAANSVTELIALAKSKPGVLNYASGGSGTSPHLAAELFKSMTGTDIVRISYKGSAPALTDLIAGQVQVMFATAPSVLLHIKSGRLRALGITSAKPSALAPGIPPIAASGVPGYEAETIYGMFAPGKTPAAIINRLNQETVRFLNRPETKERALNSGVEVVGSSSEQLANTMKAETARLGKVIKEAGIRAE